MSRSGLIFALLALFSLSHARTFNFANNCPETIWIGAVNNPGKELPNNGGWTLEAGQTSSVDTADDWAGRFWGRTGCNFDANGMGTCVTGDCGNKLACAGAGGVPPVSLAEFTLQGDQGQDFFDISLVDGFNLPMTITPDNCEGPVCAVNINENCPADLQVKSGDQVVACLSDCEKTKADEVCCRNAFNTPETCSTPPNANVFEDPCPQAYSWAYDDATSTFTCIGGNYLITFCPDAQPAEGQPANPPAAGLAPTVAPSVTRRRKCVRH